MLLHEFDEEEILGLIAQTEAVLNDRHRFGGNSFS